MMTPAQCRAARALLDWSQQQLAESATVGNATIRNFENGKSSPQHSTLDVLRRALEAAGVEFIPENGGGPGVRLRKHAPKSSDSALIDEENPEWTDADFARAKPARDALPPAAYDRLTGKKTAGRSPAAKPRKLPR
jgi:transcriptional regulator with XRE-family HTH domain